MTDRALPDYFQSLDSGAHIVAGFLSYVPENGWYCCLAVYYCDDEAEATKIATLAGADLLARIAAWAGKPLDPAFMTTTARKREKTGWTAFVAFGALPSKSEASRPLSVIQAYKNDLLGQTVVV